LGACVHGVFLTHAMVEEQMEFATVRAPRLRLPRESTGPNADWKGDGAKHADGAV
jgi:hypothetical protein